MAYILSIGQADARTYGIRTELNHIKISDSSLHEMMKIYSESRDRHADLSDDFEEFYAAVAVECDEYFHGFHPGVGRRDVIYVAYHPSSFTYPSNTDAGFKERRSFEDFIVSYFIDTRKFYELAENGYWREHL